MQNKTEEAKQIDICETIYSIVYICDWYKGAISFVSFFSL